MKGDVYAGAVAWYEPTTCPLESYRSILYGFPAVHAEVSTKDPTSPASEVVMLPLAISTAALFNFGVYALVFILIALVVGAVFWCKYCK
jgi:hypothetical protein